MNRAERNALRAILDDIDSWRAAASSILTEQDRIDRAAKAAIQQFHGRLLALPSSGDNSWWALPLRSADASHLRIVAIRHNIPTVTAADLAPLKDLADAAASTRSVQSMFGLRRVFSGAERKARAQEAADRIREYHGRALRHNLPYLLHRLDAALRLQRPEPTIAQATEPGVGLLERMPQLRSSPVTVDVRELSDLQGAMQTLQDRLRAESTMRRTAFAAGERLRHRDAEMLVADMPLERLRDATQGRLVLRPLFDIGWDRVGHVLGNAQRLQSLPGVGTTSSMRLVGAARTILHLTYEETPVRINIQRRNDQATTALLAALRDWDAVRSIRSQASLTSAIAGLAPLVTSLRGSTHVVIADGTKSHDDFRAAVTLVRDAAARLQPQPSSNAAGDPWEDFLARPADYYAMLDELGLATDNAAKVTGDLPSTIVDAIRRFQLNTDHLTASLRGYQRFATGFALVQQKVVIGDEMGLGKTVEALAVLCHLRSQGKRRFVVVCPAAVVTNWVREIRDKSRLRAHRVHGSDAALAAQNWVRTEGVAVTTYETLRWFAYMAMEADDVGAVVVDEAHYIKNPLAQRSSNTALLIKQYGHAVLLTGTPMENRIDEFRTLVGYVQPRLALDGSGLSPARFRKQVAPAYLRRNQSDVLDELPELIETEEWLPMSQADEVAYRQAVWEGNFMAMRQAAMRGGLRSEKMHRLVEIIEDARDNGRRVLVFSYFRSVLDDMATVLSDQTSASVFGPINGSVPATRRQEIIDQFSKGRPGSVLISQISAGGVGLNIQAASVIIICEPQLKPTTEWQAIARAHRMGQLQSVQVHRLLSDEGVDRRITEILAEKARLFERFARDSATAHAAPEAFDVSEAELARQVIAEERERLHSNELISE